MLLTAHFGIAWSCYTCALATQQSHFATLSIAKRTSVSDNGQVVVGIVDFCLEINVAEYCFQQQPHGVSPCRFLAAAQRKATYHNSKSATCLAATARFLRRINAFLWEGTRRPIITSTFAPLSLSLFLATSVTFL